jgi:hypothetical protein
MRQPVNQKWPDQHGDDGKPKMVGHVKVAKFFMVWMIILSGWSVFLWKAASIEMSRLSISIGDITSLVLALFSVALAIVLYIRSERVSSEFFMRSAEFTERVAELLSRIELGSLSRTNQSEENLKVMRQLLAELRDEAADRSPRTERKATNIEQEADNCVVQSIADQRDYLISKLERITKQRFTDVNALVAEVDALEGEYRLRMKSDAVSAHVEPVWIGQGALPDLPSDLIDSLRSSVLGALGGPSDVIVAAADVLESRFAGVSALLPKNQLELARKHELVDRENNLTGLGVLVLRRLAESEAGLGKA